VSRGNRRDIKAYLGSVYSS